MCSHHPKVNYQFLFVSLALFLGIFTGFQEPNSFFMTVAEMISEIFIKIFKAISLPIIFLSLVVTFVNVSYGKNLQKYWQKTVVYTFGTTLFASLTACVLYLLINPNNVASDEFSMPANANVGFVNYVKNLVPEHVFQPFMKHEVIGVLLLAIVLGAAILKMQNQRAKDQISYFFKGWHEIFLNVTTMVIKVIPVALFGFIAVSVQQFRDGEDFSSIFEYLLVIIVANVVQGFVILPIWLKIKGHAPYDAMKKMLPALAVAFFSKSSTGSLPITMQTAEQNLGIKAKVSRFIFPLCTTINMNGCAAFIFTTVIFVMQNHGVEITFGLMFVWVFVAVIAAIGNAGVPMGCFFLSASLLASMDVPINLLGVILPFYSIIDMIETALNVWSDTCVAKVVNDEIEA